MTNRVEFAARQFSSADNGMPPLEVVTPGQPVTCLKVVAAGVATYFLGRYVAHHEDAQNAGGFGADGQGRSLPGQLDGASLSAAELLESVA